MSNKTWMEVVESRIKKVKKDKHKDICALYWYVAHDQTWVARMLQTTQPHVSLVLSKYKLRPEDVNGSVTKEYSVEEGIQILDRIYN